MTETLDRPTPAAHEHPDRAAAWFADFEQALADRDVDRAAGLFATTSFWRDLVAFTWNLKTVEDRAGVADLLHQTLATTDPDHFALSEPSESADGVTTAWFTFDTA